MERQDGNTYDCPPIVDAPTTNDVDDQRIQEPSSVLKSVLEDSNENFSRSKDPSSELLNLETGFSVNTPHSPFRDAAPSLPQEIPTSQASVHETELQAPLNTVAPVSLAQHNTLPQNQSESLVAPRFPSDGAAMQLHSEAVAPLIRHTTPSQSVPVPNPEQMTHIDPLSQPSNCRFASTVRSTDHSRNWVTEQPQLQNAPVQPQAQQSAPPGLLELFTDTLKTLESIARGTSFNPQQLKTKCAKLRHAINSLETAHHSVPVPDIQANVPYDIDPSSGCSGDQFTICRDPRQAADVSQVPPRASSLAHSEHAQRQVAAGDASLKRSRFLFSQGRQQVERRTKRPRGKDAPETVTPGLTHAAAVDLAAAMDRPPTRQSSQGGWSPAEDDMLRVFALQHNQRHWKSVAHAQNQRFPNSYRTDIQCLHRWQKVLHPDLKKGPWTAEEDTAVRSLVQQYGTNKWSDVAKQLPGRIGKQCRERWFNHLDPSIKKGPWSEDEEETLMACHEKFGNKWVTIAKFLPGRTDNAIKNHFHGIRRRAAKNAQRSSEDSTADITGSTENQNAMSSSAPRRGNGQSAFQESRGNGSASFASLQVGAHSLTQNMARIIPPETSRDASQAASTFSQRTLARASTPARVPAQLNGDPAVPDVMPNVNEGHAEGATVDLHGNEPPRKRRKSMVQEITPVPDSATPKEASTLASNEFEGWREPIAVAVTGTDNEKQANGGGHNNFEQITSEVLGAQVSDGTLNALAESATEGNHQQNTITPRGSPIRKRSNPSGGMMGELFVDSSRNVSAQQPFAALPRDSVGNSAVRGSEEVGGTLTPLRHDDSPGKLSVDMSPENNSPFNLREPIDFHQSGFTRIGSQPLNSGGSESALTPLPLNFEESSTADLACLDDLSLPSDFGESSAADLAFLDDPSLPADFEELCTPDLAFLDSPSPDVRN